MDANRIERRLRFLELYAIGATVAVLVLVLSAFQVQQQTPEKVAFKEIDVERINVIEPDGKYRMVLSNRPRSIGPIYKGQPFGYPGGSRPGIIFFNDENTEMGGLTFHGQRRPDGTYSSGGHFSFDQFNQDQVIYMQYQDQNGQRRMGLTVADRADIDIFELVQQRDSIQRMPDGPAKTAAMERLVAPRNGTPLFAPRGFFGRDPAKNAVLNLADASGKTRLRLVVDSLGTAAIEFLDPAGAVTRRIGER